MSDRVFVLKGAASAPEAAQLERVVLGWKQMPGFF